MPPKTPPKRSGTPVPSSNTGWREKDPDDIDTTPEQARAPTRRGTKRTGRFKLRPPPGIPQSDDEMDVSPIQQRTRKPKQYLLPGRPLFQRRPPSLAPVGTAPRIRDSSGSQAGPSAPGPVTPEEAAAAGNKRKAEANTRKQPRPQRRRVGTDAATGYGPTTPPGAIPLRRGGPVEISPTQWVEDEDMDNEREDSDDEPDPPSPTAARQQRRIVQATGTRGASGANRQLALAQAAREHSAEVRRLAAAFGGLNDEPMVLDPPFPPTAKMMKILRDMKEKLNAKKRRKSQQQDKDEDDEMLWSDEEQVQPKEGTTLGRYYHPYRPLVEAGINRHSPQATRVKDGAGADRPPEPPQPASARPSRPTLQRKQGEEDLAAAARRAPSYTAAPQSKEFTLRERKSFVIEEDQKSHTSDLYYYTPLKRTGHAQKVRCGSGQIFNGRFRKRGGENYIMAFPYDIRFLIYKELLFSQEARLIKAGRGAPLVTFGLDIEPFDIGIMLTCKAIYLEAFRVFYGLNTFEIKVNWEYYADPLTFLPEAFGLAVRQLHLSHDFKINPNLKNILHHIPEVEFYHYPHAPSTRVLDYDNWAPILQRLQYLHVEWKVESWVRHQLYAGADLEKEKLTKKDLWDGWDGIWVAMQMYKNTQQAGTQRTSSYYCYRESWNDPRYAIDIESDHVCGVRCKYMADFFGKMWETNLGADINLEDYQ
ncbi:hypothetical protein B0T21DRAFT_380847 [Apiosordaria backusii]|uniref:Uncharacterized protein n=1 Tax=Apiosordaria backusii TaxID=314023 RepID=A0AA40K3K3_9PEZI|nr:hypothetical protein B0T21DRAFT_380847 [Apiosordaria backusii]